jgi:hypothetical protein
MTVSCFIHQAHDQHTITRSTTPDRNRRVQSPDGRRSVDSTLVRNHADKCMPSSQGPAPLQQYVAEVLHYPAARASSRQAEPVREVAAVCRTSMPTDL